MGVQPSGSEALADGSIPDCFFAVARLAGDRLAIADGDRSLTYSALSELIVRIAGAVADAARGRAGPVAIVLEHELEFPAAILGVLAAGHICLPLNPHHPPERNKTILAHAGAAAIIARGRLMKAAQALSRAAVIDIDSLPEAAGGYRGRAHPDDDAFIIYTSGSTGTPKGVVHSHANLLHDVGLSARAMELRAEDRLALFYPPSVIGGLRHVLVALLNGASLHILRTGELGSAGLAREIQQRRITIIRGVPQLFRHMAASLGSGERFDNVRHVRLSGDRVDWADYDAFRRACRPDAKFFAGIASTECPSGYLGWDVSDASRDGLAIPAGRVTPGYAVSLQDEVGRPVPDHEIGEFVVRSGYIALGYWKEPELTAQSFAADPQDPKTRTFRTGDLGRLRPDGLFEFVGRRDQQIKLSGHRIEPAEIETALRACPGVRDGAVVVRRDTGGRVRALAAHVELQPSAAGMLPRHLRHALDRLLPAHMVPAVIRVVDALPRLPNFKIDRVRMAELDAAQDSFQRGNDPLLDDVTTAVEQALGVKGATPEDSIASLGGDSMQAVHAIIEIERRFNLDLPPDIFERTQSIAELAQWISQQQARSERFVRRRPAAGVSARRETSARLPPALQAWPFNPIPRSALQGSVVDRFDEIVRRFPERLAVSDRTQSLTYAALSDLADKVAAAIASEMAGNGPVAILMANEARLPAALLGVLAAGRAYLVLDCEHPPERNLRIMHHAQASAVISADDMARSLRPAAPPGLPVIDLDSLTPGASPRPAARPTADDLCWIIYTSGSAGDPKGVYQNHGGTLHDIMLNTATMRISPDDRLALFYPPSLVSGNRVVFGALLNGASLHVLSPKELSPRGLAEEIRDRNITIIRAVPQLFRRVAEALSEGEHLDSIRLVSLGGDRVEWSDLDVVAHACGRDVPLSIHLGATEVSTLYLECFVDPALRETAIYPPVGRPLPDREVKLIDESGEAVADGEIGEFVVKSRYLALGYWQAPQMTALAFSTDANDPAVRIYRTGDLGRQRTDGLFEFHGRKDQQIKVAGQRVELGEIESALRRCAGVHDAAVIARETGRSARKVIVAYCELQPGIAGLLPRHVKFMLGQALPSHMIPAHIFIVDALPRLSNLKLDRARLVEMDATGNTGRSVRTDDPLVGQLVALFETTLDVSGATPEDNLASLGGDSLQAVNLLTELERRFELHLPVEVFAQAESIEALARWITIQRASSQAMSEGAIAE